MFYRPWPNGSWEFIGDFNEIMLEKYYLIYVLIYYKKKIILPHL